MSFGKSSGSSTQTVTQELSPEEKALIGTQTDFLQDLYPRIGTSLDEAAGAYDASVTETGEALTAARTGTEEAKFLGQAGLPAYGQGIDALSNLFSDQYLADRTAAAQDPIREEYAQQRQATSNAFAGAGQPTSRRAATAQALGDAAAAESLGRAARDTRTDVEALRAGQAGNLVDIGASAIGQRERLADKELDYAGLPLDLAGDLSAILHGTPRDNPNFARDTTTTGKQSGSSFSSGNLAPLLLSDATVKSDIKLLGTKNGINVYSYFHEVYKKWEIGVLAQEIKEIIPHAVEEINGKLHVDYSKINKRIQEV